MASTSPRGDLGQTPQRILGAAARTPPAGAVGGWGAAHVLGVGLCDGLASDGRTRLDVPLCSDGHNLRPVPGIAVWDDPLPEADVLVVEDVRVTAPLRTCFDGMRRAEDLVEAVVFADLMAHADLVDLAGLRDSAALGRHGRQGA